MLTMNTSLELDEDVFEKQVLASPFSVDTWINYIDFQRQAPSEDRYVIYERALQLIPRSYKIWVMYLQERSKLCYSRPVDVRAAEAARVIYAFERALSSLSLMPVLWLLYAKFVWSMGLVTRTRRVFDRAIQSLPITQHHHIWKRYICFAASNRCPGTGGLSVKSCVPAETCIFVYKRYIKLVPSARQKFAESLEKLGRHGELMEVLSDMVNSSDDIDYKRPRQEIWAQLCALLSAFPESVPSSLDGVTLLRSGLVRYSQETAKLWIALAGYYTRLSEFEMSRDVFEEALEAVGTVKDFAEIFESYAVFEDTMLRTKMETGENEADEDSDDDYNVSGDDIDLRLLRLEDLMSRRPMLLNTVLLKQNPHNVKQWLKRVRLVKEKGDHTRVASVYRDAIAAIDPSKSRGRLYQIWCGFARFYEDNADLEGAKNVFEKALMVKFKTVEELAEVYCHAVEMYLRHKRYSTALDLVKRATASAPPVGTFFSSKKKSSIAVSDNVQKDIWRNTKIWHLYADLEESINSFESARTVYERMIELKVCTAASVLQYAAMLEEHRFFEAAFSVYEKGIALFSYPHVGLIWNTYLTKFVERYQGKKLERARELFEQALKEVPEDTAKPLYLLYANLEERFGLSRHAMAVYDRAVAAVADSDKMAVLKVFLRRASDLFGVSRTRQIYEKAIEIMPSLLVRDVCMDFANLEQSLGEIDRVRGIYSYCASLCNPDVDTEFWSTFHDFEVSHGNEDTFREMLRLRRTVAAEMTQTQHTATTASLTQPNVSEREDPANSVEIPVVEPVEAMVPVSNPEEIDLLDEADDFEQDGNVTIEQKHVPDAVFGAVLEHKINKGS